MNGNRFNKGLIYWGVIWIACIVMTSTGYTAELTATRTYDLDYTAGQILSVSLDITIPSDLNLSSIIVKEILPPGWTFVSSQPDASTFNAGAREYKWLVWGTSVSSQQIQYTVTAQGLDAFQGEVIYADSNDEVHKIPIETNYPAYQIDSILPLTGALSDYGVKIRNGIELAIADHNVTNIKSTRTLLTSNSYDNQSASDTVDAMIEAADNDANVLALLGGAASETTLRMAGLCENHQLPLFSPTSTATLLSDKDSTINIVPLDNYQVDAVHEVLIDCASNEFFLIADDSPYGRSFIDLSHEEGLVMTGSYLFSSASFNIDDLLQLLEQTFQSNNPFIVMAVYEDEVNLLLKTFTESGNASIRNAAIILTDAGATTQSIAGLPEEHNLNIYGLNPIVPETAFAAQFKNNYTKTYGAEPEWISYYGHDAVAAFSAALKNATEITRQGIWQAIPWMRFEGLTGTKTFNEQGNLYSAAYDLHYVSGKQWLKAETILVAQPENVTTPTGKIASRSTHPSNAAADFTYALTAADPLISHLAGKQAHDTGWIAEPLDAPIGGVIMAYYEDIERGLSTDNQPFVFEDERTYYLTFNVLRERMTTEPPVEGDILDINVKSVYRYQNGDDVTHFARQDLMNHQVSFADWPDESSMQITIPIVYQSTAPDGLTINNEDNRFHWELKLLNTAQQRVLLTKVEIGTDVPTAVEDYMLH